MPSQSLQDRRCAQPPDPLALDEVRGFAQRLDALLTALQMRLIFAGGAYLLLENECFRPPGSSPAALRQNAWQVTLARSRFNLEYPWDGKRRIRIVGQSREALRPSDEGVPRMTLRSSRHD